MTVKQEILLVAIMTMVMMIQGFVFMILVILGIYAFKIDPFKKDIRKMTYAAFFIILNTVFQSITLQVPLFGFPSLEIGISSVPLMLAGVFLGPSWAYVTGLVCDLLGLIVAPTNFPFLGFTLSSVLRSLLPALVYYYSKKYKRLEFFLTLSLSLLFIMVTFYIFNLDKITISKVGYEVDFSTKTSLILLITSIIILSIVFCVYIKKTHAFLYQDLMLWMIIVLYSEVLLSLILSPLWLNVMYSIDPLASIFVRIFKALFMIPIQIVLCFILHMTLTKVMIK